MLIRKLSLTGFKSFVEPATLFIEPGLSGVVGPNGCGKSNLFEAIRWVMGENSPRSMRSGGMEDVIFAGTATRPPRDFSEVVLHAVGDDGDELVITRRIERGAGSAYRINGRDVRARDVALTFADAATGAHSPALVSQGRIAAVIAAKPAERRQMLEEAAGIAGLHVRRRDAENRLRQTEANLARLDDLLSGLDQQVAGLKRQARQAERYRALSGQIETAEARLLFARWREADEAAAAAERQSHAAGDAVADTERAVALARDAHRKQAAKLAQARDALADRRDDLSAHGQRMAALVAQHEAADERLADLDRQQARLQTERGDSDRLTRDAAQALHRLGEALTDGERTLEADEATRPALASRIERAERSARTAELALAKVTAENAGREAEWRVAEGELAQARDRLARLEREAERVAARRREFDAAGDADEAAASARMVAASAAATLAQAHDRLEAAQQDKAAAVAARDEAGTALAGARADLAGIEREWHALTRDRAARATASTTRDGAAAALDKVTAAPGFERALAAVLGRDADALLGPPGDEEGRFWTGAPAPATVAQSLAGQMRACPPELAARLALVHVSDEDDGRLLNPGEWLVTRRGRLRRWDGLVAFGEGAAAAAQLEADNRLVALDDLLPGRRAAAEAAAADEARAQSALAAAHQAFMGAERVLAEAAEAERRALRELAQAEAASERMGMEQKALGEAEADLASRREGTEAELAEVAVRRDALPDPAAGRGVLEAARVAHEAARSEVQAAAAALSARDQALGAARERVAGQRADMRGWQARAGDAARRLAEMEQLVAAIAGERKTLAAKEAHLLAELEAGEAVRGRLREALAASENATGEASEASETAEAALALANEAYAEAREARAGLAAQAANAASRREELTRASGDRFQRPPPLLGAAFNFAAGDIGGSEDERVASERLIAERERIGSVNLVAAEELTRIEAEHGAHAAEQAELAEAVRRLRGSIGSLNREGRERLAAAFAAVDGHFRRLFTRLFEGGAAHLALIDNDDPLEAGLEIYAQPPGKRLQSLNLLSGGEQALTAIALIFALFLTNPAPICVLDEVDAPLDDANIDRFCDLLDAMVLETATRYLIVTHNAVTMSRMHRLFGVTMVEQGVSRLVSVDLGAAEQLLAAE